MSDLSDLDRVDDAARVIADYVAESYECMAQIEMAKRRFAELKRRAVSALAPIEQDLSAAEQYRCQLCSATDMILDVHHNTYQRLGVEQPGDLIVLCRPCHTKHHTELPDPEVTL